MEEGMGDWVREQVARPRFRNDASPQYRALFDATKVAMREPSWDLAHAHLRPRIDAVLAEAVADRFERLMKQLYVLARMHGKISGTRPMPMTTTAISSHTQQACPSSPALRVLQASSGMSERTPSF
jgi:hypothetical protein